MFLLCQGTQLRCRLRILPTRIAHPHKDMRSLSCQRLDNQTPKTTIATCDQDRLSCRTHHLLLTSREEYLLLLTQKKEGASFLATMYTLLPVPSTRTIERRALFPSPLPLNIQKCRVPRRGKA